MRRKPVALGEVAAYDYAIIDPWRQRIRREVSKRLHWQHYYDWWVLRANSRNQNIAQAPLIILTGAGASVPLGVTVLKLPPTILLASGMTIETSQIVPSASEELDLEGLMIMAQILKELPSKVLNEGLEPGKWDRHIAVVTALVRMMMPSFSSTIAGKTYLSYEFVKETVERIIDLNRRMNSKFLEELYDAIHKLILDSCLSIAPQRIVPTYGPLLKRLQLLLERTYGQGVTIPIFTTNYDETFEYISSELSSEMVDKFSLSCNVFTSTKPLPDYPLWHAFDQAGYASYKPHSSPDTLNLVVFYLHGSLRWGFVEQGKDKYAVYIVDRQAARGIFHRCILPPDGQKVLYGKSHEGISALMAPSRKDPFRPGSIYYPMRLGYRFLQECLKYPKVVLSIGYSFRDNDCLGLMMERWKKDAFPKLLLFDPHPEPVLQRLGYPDQVSWVKGYFGNEESLDKIESTLEKLLI